MISGKAAISLVHTIFILRKIICYTGCLNKLVSLENKLEHLVFSLQEKSLYVCTEEVIWRVLDNSSALQTIKVINSNSKVPHVP